KPEGFGASQSSTVSDGASSATVAIHSVCAATENRDRLTRNSLDTSKDKRRIPSAETRARHRRAEFAVGNQCDALTAVQGTQLIELPEQTLGGAFDRPIVRRIVAASDEAERLGRVMGRVKEFVNTQEQ